MSLHVSLTIYFRYMLFCVGHLPLIQLILLSHFLHMQTWVHQIQFHCDIFNSILQILAFTTPETTHIFATGRITSWKEDSPGHSMSFACSLHKQCREAKAYRSLPQDFQVFGRNRWIPFLFHCMIIFDELSIWKRCSLVVPLGAHILFKQIDLWNHHPFCLAKVQAMRWMQMGLQITDRESGAAQHRKLCLGGFN